MSPSVRTVGVVLLPPACPSCGRPGPAPCEACWRRLRPAPAIAPPRGLDACASLLVYEREARELVARLKYRNARSVVAWLAGGMAALVEARRDDLGPELVTWAPTTAVRRRERGFDQAEVLARAVAWRLRLPVRGLLVRSTGAAQTGRPAAERRHGPTFGVRAACAGASVLVVDDVMTTGATLTAAAEALRHHGVWRVAAVTAARTPLKVVVEGADA